LTRQLCLRSYAKEKLKQKKNDLELLRGDSLRAKLYVYPYRIAERKPHPILWSFDTEALNEIAKRFENKSVFNVEIKEKTITLRLIK